MRQQDQRFARPTALDRLLGRGVVIAGPDGGLQLNDVALAAELHHAPGPGRPRCGCAVCRERRDAERVACLPSYLGILLAEVPLDEEEIRRVRREIRAHAATATPGQQPWEPRPARKHAA